MNKRPKDDGIKEAVIRNCEAWDNEFFQRRLARINNQEKGFSGGEAWAMQCASPEELGRLEKLQWYDWIGIDPNDITQTGSTCSDRLMWVIDPSLRGQDCSRLWEAIAGFDLCNLAFGKDVEYLREFVRGALSILHSAEAQRDTVLP